MIDIGFMLYYAQLSEIVSFDEHEKRSDTNQYFAGR